MDWILRYIKATFTFIIIKWASYVCPMLYVFLITKLKLLLGFHIEPVSLVNCFVHLQEFKKCPECGEKVKRKHLTRLFLHAGPDYHGARFTAASRMQT